MTKSFVRSSLTTLACAAVLAVASPAMAAMVNLKAEPESHQVKLPPTKQQLVGFRF